MPAAPLPRALPPLIPPLASQHCCSLSRKGPQETPGLPARPPACACGGSLHASPKPGVRTPMSFSPSDKRENSKLPLGSVVLPRVLGPAASQLCGGGTSRAQSTGRPGSPTSPPTAPACCCLCNHNLLWGLRSPEALPMNLASGLCPQKPASSCPPLSLLGQSLTAQLGVSRAGKCFLSSTASHTPAWFMAPRWTRPASPGRPRPHHLQADVCK